MSFSPQDSDQRRNVCPLVTRSEVTVSSDNSSKMVTRPPRVDGKWQITWYQLLCGRPPGRALNIPKNTQRWQISQNMIITVGTQNYLSSSNLLRNWRTEMPGRVLSRANCCQSRGPCWVIAPSVGQLGHRAVRVTWAMADTVIIINATQCRAFSHLQLRSKSPGQWDTKNSFDQRTSDICGRDHLMEPLSVQCSYRQPSICHYKLRITCSVRPQINYYWI